MNLSLSRNVPRIDHREVQARQRTAWASGDYAVAGNALQIVSEELCETVNLCQDERVLDVAAGSFHASFAAARRWCEVTATDYASDLTNRSRQRAEAAAVGVQFVDADAEGLPFADQSFSAVISAFGAMFAADQERAASEMIRVCRRGGRVGLANWTPDGFIGQLFATVAKHVAAGDLRSGAVPLGHRGPTRRVVWRLRERRILTQARGAAREDADGLGGQAARRLRTGAEGLRVARTCAAEGVSR